MSAMDDLIAQMRQAKQSFEQFSLSPNYNDDFDDSIDRLGDVRYIIFSRFTHNRWIVSPI